MLACAMSGGIVWGWKSTQLLSLKTQNKRAAIILYKAALFIY